MEAQKHFIKRLFSPVNDIIFLSGASFIEHLTITVIYNVKLQQGFVFF